MGMGEAAALLPEGACSPLEVVAIAIEEVFFHANMVRRPARRGDEDDCGTKLFGMLSIGDL